MVHVLFYAKKLRQILRHQISGKLFTAHEKQFDLQNLTIKNI